jgi:hypothetical protein
MANVILLEQLRAWNRETIGRLILTASAAIVVTSIVTVLALLPSYIDTRASVVALTTFRDATPAGNSETAPTERSTLNGARKRLAALDVLGAEYRLAEAVALIIDLRPQKTRIHAFVYVREGKKGTLNITGVIENRTLLKGYAELKGREIFSNATIPLASLAGSDSGAFSLSVTGDF